MSSVGSPSAYLLWSILAVIFEVFLILHLWCYDRFKCLKWDSGRQPGTFKRVMTYSYLATLPLLLVFAVSVTVIKFKEGYIENPITHVIMPKPIRFWTESHRMWALPLFFVISVAWSLEIVTHLEELTFWLFLLHQGPSKRDWFQSWEFRLWYLGSLIAALGLPITTLLTRHDLDNCIAWIFTLGSSAGAVTTLAFVYVLAKFPGFIRHVKAEGAVPDIIVRLVTFFQLNLIRIAFRVLFNFPLMIVGLDGVRGNHSIVLSRFWPDFLLMLGGIGSTVSSVITLLIFFPRSVTNESGYNARIPSAHSAAKIERPEGGAVSSLPEYNQFADPPPTPKSPDSPYRLSHMSSFRFPDPSQQREHHYRRFSNAEIDLTPEYESGSSNTAVPPSPTRPTSAGSPFTTAEEQREQRARRHSQSYHYQRTKFTSQQNLQVEGASRAPTPVLHPYIMNFTSPIDLFDQPKNTSDPPPRPTV